MSRVLKNILKIINKNHIAMILVLMIIFIIPSKAFANQKDYSKFNWDSFYEENKHFWGHLCDDDSNEKECNDTILYYQKNFYTKLYDLLAKYQKKGIYINDDIITTTVFFELLPTYGGNPTQQVYYKQFYAGSENGRAAIKINDDYSIETDQSEEGLQNSMQSFSNEDDTIKMLLSSSVAYYTYCYGSYGAPTVTEKEDGSSIKTCPSGSSLLEFTYKGRTLEKCALNLSATSLTAGNELGFIDYFKSLLAHGLTISFFFNLYGDFDDDDYYLDCESRSEVYPDGTYYAYYDSYGKNDPHVSYKKYFDFLKTSRFFDSRPHLQTHFKDILEAAQVDCMTDAVCTNSLEAKGEYDTYEEQIEEIREDMIDSIISILKYQGIDLEYGTYGSGDYVVVETSTPERSSYYWPIGGEEITEENGIRFAKGKPTKVLSDVESYYGTRSNPVTGVQEIHNGIDITTEDGVTNVIGVNNGVVVSIVSNCVTGDYSCNEGYGNTVIISHSNGDYSVYAHLASIDPQITYGVTVFTGELLGIAGTTGECKSSNLLYELRVGGNTVNNAVDPINNTPAGKSIPPNDDDLRPTTFSSGGLGARLTKFAATRLTKAEFSGLVSKYCSVHPKAVAKEMCDNPEKVYEVSQVADVDPELVVVRAIAEGNSPGSSKHNYWGIRCYNGQPEKCSVYANLEEGIKGFASATGKYENLAHMMSKYAYIGTYWANPGSWGDGGCKYFPLIKEFMTPTRQSEVEAICSKSTTCSVHGQGDCTKTLQEDQDAYASWQVDKNMGKIYFNVFGT